MTMNNHLLRVAAFLFIFTIGAAIACLLHGASLDEFVTIFLAVFTVRIACDLDDRLKEDE